MSAKTAGILIRAGLAVVGWIAACLLAPDHIGAVAIGVIVGLLVATPIGVLTRRRNESGPAGSR